MPSAVCVDCSAPFIFTRGRGRPRIRCFKCSPQQLGQPGTYVRSPERTFACAGPGCTAVVTHTFQSAKFCSARCRHAASNRSARHRVSHKRVGGRRSRVRKAGGRYETFDTYAVFERDGWRCRACKTLTPRELRGKFVDEAPELDHVVPIAKKGDHSMENTQCLCRRCNLIKSDGTMADLLAALAAA